MSAKAIKVTDANFKEVILEATIPALLEMWNPGCGPCKPFAAIVEQTAAEFEGRMIVAQMNTDDAPLTTAQLRNSGVPALFFFHQGKMVKCEIGAKTLGQMRAMCEAFFGYCTANDEAQRAYAEALQKAVEKREAGMKAWHKAIDEAEATSAEAKLCIELRVQLDEHIAKIMVAQKADLDAAKITQAEFKQFYSIEFNELMNNPPEEMKAQCRAYHDAVMAKMKAMQPQMEGWNNILKQVFDQYNADLEEADRKLREALAS